LGIFARTVDLLPLYTLELTTSFTYDHRTLKIELPVRSAVLKQCTGGLVVRWVTTSEYPLLYVFVFLLDVTREEEDGVLSFWRREKAVESGSVLFGRRMGLVDK
jgi:hypothetical protein